MENNAADGGDAVLDALTAAAGVAPGFHDIWGREYAASDETKCALLQALGYRVDTEDDRRAALEFANNRPWSRLIDPVVIIASEAGPPAVDIAVADGRDGLNWTIRTEDGSELHGQASRAALPVLDRRPDIPGRGAVTRYRLDLHATLPEGYHQLVIDDGGGPDGGAWGETTLIVAPPRCWTPQDTTGDARLWGVSCQLYSLMEDGDDGIGTFSHLKRFATDMARAGADTIGLNPLHSLYPVEPAAASPYSPSSRDFLNPMYIDIHAIPEAGAADLAQLPVVGADDLIDYDVVARRAWRGLEAVFAAFRRLHPEGGGSEREAAFKAFRDGGGEAGAELQARALHDFALFMAIQESKAGDDLSSMPWWAWGEAFAHPEAPGSRAFAETHAERVHFHQWCQFIADEQLGDAANAADAAGLRLGLYRDLAIGVGPASAAAWADPQALVRGVSVGAPPDLLNRKGQDWGLAPLDPLYLRETAFKPLIQGLRANMRHAGAIRIDHVMGLMHLYWIPAGRPADEGTYVSYPFEEMLRILALESRRHKAIVIGEDLGTVPEGFRDRMTAAGVLSYKVMPFERVGDGLFKRGTSYSPLSVCTFGTHDLPTVDGWWSGRDVAWRSHIGHHGSEEDRDADARSRSVDRQRLIDALVDAGVWPPDRAVDIETPEPMSQPLREAIHAFLARADSCLMVVQIEDALALVDQMNLPGTTVEHPNWRRRLPRAVSNLAEVPSVRGVLDTVASIRGRHGVGGENA
ncbi:4-alpha-glucanotransferase [Fodinicurvata sp. EGI_FJ10296]|uniref:4-alpha-glucanotransferase n=1 Tax=Fodinicurvata sp. EGI_FJ10296 TaxID=3231908 RepID=UPI003451D03C